MNLEKLSSFPIVASSAIRASVTLKENSPSFEPVKNEPKEAKMHNLTFQVSGFPESQGEKLSFQMMSIHKPKSALEIPKVHRIPRTELQELLSLDYEGRRKKVEQLLGSYVTKSKTEKFRSTLLAIIRAESNFNPAAVSADGYESKGLFQILDKTGFTIRDRLADFDNYDPFNPSQNIKYGTSYFEYLLKVFQTPTKLANGYETVPGSTEDDIEQFAIAAFNAGEGRVALAQSLAKRKGLNPAIFSNVVDFLPKITQGYVKKVLTFKQEFDTLSNGLEFASIQ